MNEKTNRFAMIKQLFKPERGSDKWLQHASKEAILAYRKELWKKLFNPNEDTALRWRIRDSILPYIDKILRDRDK